MAIYNGYTNPYMIQPQYQPAPQNGIIWIQGEAAAKSYLVAPNSSVALWDSERQSIYIKSADAAGMPSMKVIDYTIRDQTHGNGPVSVSAPQTIDLSGYVTKAEFEALQAQIEALKAKGDVVHE